MLANHITVIDVLRELRIEPNPKLTWSIGQQVMRRFAKRYGRQPVKDLRKKTYTEGVHCFALYPPEFKPEIVAAIRAHRTESARQGMLAL